MSSSHKIADVNRRRSLGLRQVSRKSTISVKTKSTTNVKGLLVNTSQSELINKSQGEKDIETTPKNKKLPSLQSQSAPPNFRPYRLSLSKRLRDRMTKNRLEFQKAQGDNCETIADSDEDSVMSTVNDTPITNKKKNHVEIINESPNQTPARRKLIHQMEIVEEEMQARQKHIAKTQSLQQAIACWRKGFHESITDLQQNIEPYQEKTILMRSFGIDQNLYRPDEDD